VPADAPPPPEAVDTPQATEDDRPAQADKTRIAFIDIGRAIGALLVFYSHIAEQWVHRLNDRFAPIDWIDALTSVPMHMAKQGIGQIAVPVFFLISGYVVTPIALRQGQRRFAVNRLFRVYPPLIFVVLLTAAILSLGENPLATGQLQTISPLTLLTNSLLVNYLIYPQVVLVGVAWTMIIEVTFYVVLVLMLPVLRRWVWFALATELTLIFVVLMTRKVAGPSWALFAVNVSYLPIPIMGQIIWAGYSRRIKPWLAGVFLAVAWSLYVLADVLGMGRIDSSYNLALAVAVLFFLLGLFAEPRLRQRRFWTGLSERSYSLYLLHGLIAFVALDLLRPHLPFAVALVVAVAATFGVVELSYRFVEKPSHRLARRFSRGRAVPPSTVDAPADAEPGEEHDPLADDESHDVEHDPDWPEVADWPAAADAPTTTLPRVEEPPSPPYGFPAPGGFRPMSGTAMDEVARFAGPPAAEPTAGRINRPAEPEPAWSREPEPAWPREPSWPREEPDRAGALPGPNGLWPPEPPEPHQHAGRDDGPPAVYRHGPASIPPRDRTGEAAPPALPRRGRHGAADEAATTVAELIARQTSGPDATERDQAGRPRTSPPNGAVWAPGRTPPNGHG
jgi:peptidoglycan/LPS O-acetylase OafA/YrhL